MIAMILVHPHIFWLSLGGLLLAAEMLGGNGYLLWSGVAAVITGLVVWLIPLDWAWQGRCSPYSPCWRHGCGGSGWQGVYKIRNPPTAILTSAGNSWLAVDLFWKLPGQWPRTYARRRQLMARQRPRRFERRNAG